MTIFKLLESSCVFMYTMPWKVGMHDQAQENEERKLAQLELFLQIAKVQRRITVADYQRIVQAGKQIAVLHGYADPNDAAAGVPVEIVTSIITAMKEVMQTLVPEKLAEFEKSVSPDAGRSPR